MCIRDRYTTGNNYTMRHGLFSTLKKLHSFALNVTYHRDHSTFYLLLYEIYYYIVITVIISLITICYILDSYIYCYTKPYTFNFCNSIVFKQQQQLQMILLVCDHICSLSAWINRSKPIQTREPSVRFAANTW